MIRIHPVSESVAEQSFWAFVVGSTVAGFLLGALAGRTKIHPRLKRTSLGVMLGALAGVIMADLGGDSRGVHIAVVLTFLPLGGTLGAIIGFFMDGTRTPLPGDTVEAWPPNPHRPPLWDREMDG